MTTWGELDPETVVVVDYVNPQTTQYARAEAKVKDLCVGSFDLNKVHSVTVSYAVAEKYARGVRTWLYMPASSSFLAMSSFRPITTNVMYGVGVNHGTVTMTSIGGSSSSSDEEEVTASQEIKPTPPSTASQEQV